MRLVDFHQLTLGDDASTMAVSAFLRGPVSAERDSIWGNVHGKQRRGTDCPPHAAGRFWSHPGPARLLRSKGIRGYCRGATESCRGAADGRRSYSAFPSRAFGNVGPERLRRELAISHGNYIYSTTGKDGLVLAWHIRYRIPKGHPRQSPIGPDQDVPPLRHG